MEAQIPSSTAARGAPVGAIWAVAGITAAKTATAKLPVMLDGKT